MRILKTSGSVLDKDDVVNLEVKGGANVVFGGELFRVKGEEGFGGRLYTEGVVFNLGVSATVQGIPVFESVVEYKLFDDHTFYPPQ